MQGGSDGGHSGGGGPSIQLYREVHKHAYLKHINTHHGKKSSGDQYWVVFCVHCDTVPYLEFYSTQAASATHQPIWRMCLTGTNSVSGALVPQGKLYRLTLVTRESGITLAAATWEDMKDWVDTLRTKLREMKILGPGENLYSKPPEQMVRNSRAPTRDPTSPLPPPPPGPAVYVPGTEVLLRNQNQDTLPSALLDNVEPGDDNTTSGHSEDWVEAAESSSSTNHVSINQNLPSSPYGGSAGSVVPPDVQENEPCSGTREVNRLHVAGDQSEAVSRVLVTPANEPYECLKLENRGKNASGNKYENHSVTIDGSNCSHLVVGDLDKINNLNLDEKTSRRMEPTTKVCKDGGLILYNNCGSSSNESYTSSSQGQWDSLNVALLNNMCGSSPKQDNFPSVSPSSSRVAKISGMNVCLVDSLLPHGRNVTSGSSEEDFDAVDDHSGIWNKGRNVVNIKRDSKGYTQVDVNNKKTEAFKSKLLLPLASDANSNQLVTITSNSTIFDSVVRSDNEESQGELPSPTTKGMKLKPSPLPRTKLNDPRKNGVPDDNMSLQGGVYVSLTECNTTNQAQKEEVVLREGKERDKYSLNRTSSVPDSIQSEYILHTFCGEMVDTGSSSWNKQDPSVESSNVTIISVSNQSPTEGPSTAIPIVGRQFDFDSSQLNNMSDGWSGTSGRHANVSVTNIDTTSRNTDHVQLRCNADNVYGHIHDNSDSRELEVDRMSQGVESKRASLESSQPRDSDTRGRSNIKFSKDLEIPEFKKRNSDKIEIPKQTSRATHTKDFYESVFGPFNVNSGASTSELIQIPKLVVDIPNSPQTSNKHTSRSANSQVSKRIDHAPPQRNAKDATERDYEFLSWGRSSDRNIPSPAETLRTAGSRQGDERPAHNVSATQSTSQQQSSDHCAIKRPGLFARGLTELNIVTKFKNFVTSDEAETAPSSSGENVKKSAFTSKFNIFNKFNDSKINSSGSSPGGNLNRNVNNIVKTESSLRRNWSEHNDRTAPPNIIRDVKPLRPRPPVIAAISPRGQMIPNQNSDVDNRRRSNSLSSGRASAEEHVTAPSRPAGNPKPTVPIMSLREQQVMRLRNEMGHSGGIRLVLSSRDSPEQAVALVDIYSGVWVAGWKQRTHPLLYNALHIGDRLHSVDGCVVGSARQARRAIQNRMGNKVEIIIKRLPHGRVYALKRESDRQDLGLVLDGANITGTLPNSAAHRAGVPTNGTLTEVNGRPLNLLLKKGSTQVKDRLSSVGREVSILVQPTEFVSLLRSALKAVRGYKDYIVQ